MADQEGATIMSKFKKGDCLQINPDEESNGRVRGCLGVFTGDYRPAPDGNAYPMLLVVAPNNEHHLVIFRDEDVGRVHYMPETEWMPVVG